MNGGQLKASKKGLVVVLVSGVRVLMTARDESVSTLLPEDIMLIYHQCANFYRSLFYSVLIIIIFCSTNLLFFFFFFSENKKYIYSRGQQTHRF